MATGLLRHEVSFPWLSGVAASCNNITTRPICHVVTLPGTGSGRTFELAGRQRVDGDGALEIDARRAGGRCNRAGVRSLGRNGRVTVFMPSSIGLPGRFSRR